MSNIKKIKNNKKKSAVSSQGKKKQSYIVPIVIGGMIVIAVIIALIAPPSPAGPTAQPITEPSGVESFPEEGKAHVSVGTTVQYQTDPATSGDHYDAPLAPNFYESEMPTEALVHNLEHGHIIIHYDPEVVSEDELEQIQDLTRQYSDYWAAVVAVPRPNSEQPFILTAWTKMLRLESFDREQIDAFNEAYRGRGPENPVR